MVVVSNGLITLVRQKNKAVLDTSSASKLTRSIFLASLKFKPVDVPYFIYKSTL